MMMDVVRKILLEKNHPGIQFFKYSACGGLAFITDMTVFYLLAVYVVPSLTSEDVFVKLLHMDVTPISDSLRLRNFWIGKTCSFIMANIVAYILNVRYVFRAGKHRLHHEIALFFLISFVAFVLGAGSGDLLIRFLGVQTTYSQLTAVIFATLINYAGRKFFIFHG